MPEVGLLLLSREILAMDRSNSVQLPNGAVMELGVLSDFFLGRSEILVMVFDFVFSECFSKLGWGGEGGGG